MAEGYAIRRNSDRRFYAGLAGGFDDELSPNKRYCWSKRIKKAVLFPEHIAIFVISGASEPLTMVFVEGHIQ